MASKQFTFAYGHGTKTFDYEENDILKVVRTEDFPPMQNIEQGILDAINHPIGSPALSEIVKPGDTVAFICNDPTRVANSYDFMPVFVNEMNRLGVPDENMRIVFSLGTHRVMTHEEMVEQVGKEVASRIKMYNSVATNADDFEYFGDTSRGTPVWINKLLCDVDHVILTGTIVHHYFSGYGGGRKAILPGCAAMETVRKNHSWMLDPHAGLGIMEGNPCYEDQMEGVALFAKGRSLFLFNAVLNAKHEFLKMFAGDYIKAHKVACSFVDEVYGCVIPKEADLVIASCGGYPKETFKRLKTPEAIRKELEDNFQIGANKAFAITRPQSKADFVLVTKLDKDLAKSMHFAATTECVDEAIAIAKQKLGDHPATILMPEGSLTVPRVA